MQINNELMMTRRIKRRKYIKGLAVCRKVVNIITSDATPVSTGQQHLLVLTFDVYVAVKN